MQLKGPTAFPTEILSALFSFIQSTSLGEEAICAEERRTTWDPTVNVGVITVEELIIEEGPARYASPTRLLQDWLQEDGACVCIATRKALLDVWIWRIAALFNLDGAYEAKL